MAYRATINDILTFLIRLEKVVLEQQSTHSSIKSLLMSNYCTDYRAVLTKTLKYIDEKRMNDKLPPLKLKTKDLSKWLDENDYPKMNLPMNIILREVLRKRGQTGFYKDGTGVHRSDQ
jgi:hypothetical protein